MCSGRPLRAKSAKPPMPCCRKRPRHNVTVCSIVPSTSYHKCSIRIPWPRGFSYKHLAMSALYLRRLRTNLKLLVTKSQGKLVTRPNRSTDFHQFLSQTLPGKQKANNGSPAADYHGVKPSRTVSAPTRIIPENSARNTATATTRLSRSHAAAVGLANWPKWPKNGLRHVRSRSIISQNAGTPHSRSAWGTSACQRGRKKTACGHRRNLEPGAFCAYRTGGGVEMKSGPTGPR
jgi:hypothetical protein